MAKKDLILVIDDEEDLREMVQYQFQARGFETAAAENGLAGLEQLKVITPDLIILDLNMPKMGGVEFYHNIVDAQGRPKYPVLILTARANMEQLFRELDIDGFIAKPFEIEHLIKEAETIIHKLKRGGIPAAAGPAAGPKNVFLAEEDAAAFKDICAGLLEAGYKVNSARSGTGAIEKMMQDPPDLALISLGLKDIAGDIVAFRLRRMSKTSHAQIVLYTPKGDKHNLTVIQNIGNKEGVAAAVEYSSVNQLIEAVDKALRIQK